jgi:threonine dehydratase
MLAAIREARRMIAGSALRTPLVRLNVARMEPEIYLKLENLQPIGSFKIRGAANAMGHIPAELLAEGVVDRVGGKHGSGGRLAGTGTGDRVYGGGAGDGSGYQGAGR